MTVVRFHAGKWVAYVLFLFLIVSAPLFGQSNTTSLTGVVTDTTGAVMSGAKVSLASSASGTMQTASTQSRGEYSFEQVAPGK